MKKNLSNPRLGYLQGHRADANSFKEEHRRQSFFLASLTSLTPYYISRRFKEEKKEMYEANKLEEANTSIADYVWLPLRIREGRPVIDWKDSWSPEDEV